jgi:alcohol dehydrogenase class IV
MQSFQYLSAALRLFHGPDSLESLAREVVRGGCHRAAIFCGSSLLRQPELLGRVQAALGERCVGTFAGVRAHSPLSTVRQAADELARLQADCVVAVGGGSAIVTARAASILLAEGRDVREMCTVADGRGGLKSPKLMAPKLPQFVVPTTPTTAAVKAGSAVFDADTGERLALFDPKTRASAVFLDPVMLMSAPETLLCSSALNTLATAIEGLLSKNGNPLADAQLMHAVRLIVHRLSIFGDDDAVQMRGDLALAAVLCGQGTDHTGAGITTVLGHALGARHHIDNGTVNAIVLPHVLRFNAQAGAAGLTKVAAALGLTPVAQDQCLDAVIERLQRLWATLPLATRLRDAGVPRESLDLVAGQAIHDWFLRGNPRPVTQTAELKQILENAW